MQKPVFSRLRTCAVTIGALLASAASALSAPGQPSSWALGLQEAASPVMADIAWFHNFLLVLITAITVFVLALLVIGLCTRPAAAALALNLVGAIATAGRVDGGTFHLGVGPAMLVAMLFLVWAGSGNLAVDRSLRMRGATSPV